VGLLVGVGGDLATTIDYETRQPRVAQKQAMEYSGDG